MWPWLLLLPLLTAAKWDYTGTLPEWRHTFLDYDCRRPNNGASLDWSSLRRQAEKLPDSEWRALASQTLETISVPRVLAGLKENTQPVCPFGLLFLAVVRYGECADTPANCPDPKESETLSELIQLLFRSASLEVFLGTRWPIFAALDMLRLSPYYEDRELSCLDVENPTLDWRGLREAFHPEKDWFQAVKRFAYSREFQASWVYAMDECTYGLVMVALWKLVVCAETQAECVSQYAVLMEDMITHRDWREVAGNRWPLFGFLSRVQHGIRRHEFRLDFLPEELRGELPGPARIAPVWQVASPLLAGSVIEGETSVAFAGVLESVLAGVPQSYVTALPQGGLELRKLLYVTMVFGQQYVPYIPRFVTRAAALGIHNLVLFCLDKAARTACAEIFNGGGGHCILGSPSILNKFTLPLAYMRLGVDVFWLDFDIFLLRNPTQVVLDTLQQRQVDLLVSGSFADDCICSGLVVFKATATASEWLLTVLSWMYDHVYTHDQQAFSAFLAGRKDEDNFTRSEQISGSKLFKLYLKPRVPRWALLDPVVEFASARVLNTTGWTGRMEDMFIFHFLHGDSEVNQDHSARGWNTRHGMATKTEAILDIFYNQSDERLYTTDAPPYELSEAVRESLLASRRSERPAEMLHCGVLQLNEYSPGRMNADG